MTSLKSIWLRILEVIPIGPKLSSQVSSGEKCPNDLLMLQLFVVLSNRSFDPDPIFECRARRNYVIPSLKLWLFYNSCGWTQQHLLFRLFFNYWSLDCFINIDVLWYYLLQHLLTANHWQLVIHFVGASTLASHLSHKIGNFFNLLVAKLFCTLFIGSLHILT